MKARAEMTQGRWSEEVLGQRRLLESCKGSEDSGLEAHSFPSRLLPASMISRILTVTGLSRRGRENLLNLVVKTDEVFLPSLPEAFDGLRIMHVSDTHFDLVPELAIIAARLAKPIDFDICLFTGDFRDHLCGSGIEGVRLSAEFLAGLGKPVYACLGNHDLSSDLAMIEESGIRVLVNENVAIERGGNRIFICGIDDAGYYKTDEVGAAFRGVGADDCAILLSHDPCAYKKAAEAGAALMLSGHTHGGQICFPGGIALFTHTKCPRRMIAGAWKYKGMRGYTSSGVGGSRVPARFFSRGEIAIHILRKFVK
jgi:uncharacterized protein